MSDTWANPFAGYFFANDPNVNQNLRQKMALALLMQKRAYPKTFGEGLASIGDSIADVMTMRRIERDDLAAQAKAKELVPDTQIPPVPTTPPATRTSYAPTTEPQPPAVAAVNRIATAQPPPPIPAQPAPPLQTT